MAEPTRPTKRRGRAAPPVDGRARRRIDTRAKIRAAAYELFAANGFDETPASAIARRAGVAEGTIFTHASDKPDLLFLVMHDRLQRAVEERWATLPDGPLLDRLMHLFAGLFRMYGEHPALAAAFIRHLPGAKGPNAREVDALTLGFLHRLAQLITEARETGEVSAEVAPLRCAHNIFGLYFMALLGWVGGHMSLEIALEPVLRDSLALQIRGFRP
ncbi:MAG: TetR/AcrR family transcriptional regulator [Myxococcales bacterium]|nr:TetR/AcrR family transcriptional regulator [Myxococcales bacterium]